MGAGHGPTIDSMWKRHQLVVGTLGIFLLAGSIVMSTAGVSGATTGEGIAVAESRQGGRHGDHDRGRHQDGRKGKHDDRGKHGGKGKHDDRGKHDKCKKGHGGKGQHGNKGKCKPKPKPTTTTTTSTTTTTTTSTVPEETTSTLPEETTSTLPEETTTTAEVGGITTIRPDVQPQQEELPEVQPEVLGITQQPQPEALPSELAFTGVSNGSIAAGGAGLLLLGLALVSGGARRRRESA